MSSIPKISKCRRARSMRGKVFILKKNIGTLKINPFLKICKYLPCTSKNTRPKENIRNYIFIFKYFILGPKMANENTLAQAPKSFLFLFSLPILRLKSQFYVKFWNWGSITIWHNMTCWKCRHFLGVCCLCWGA